MIEGRRTSLRLVLALFDQDPLGHLRGEDVGHDEDVVGKGEEAMVERLVQAVVERERVVPDMQEKRLVEVALF